MKAKLPHIAIVYDRYHKASKEHKGVIEIRITYNRKQKYISTGIKLFPKEWKEKTGEVINTPDATVLNKLLNNKVAAIKEVLYTMVQEGNIDINDIGSLFILGDLTLHKKSLPLYYEINYITKLTRSFIFVSSMRLPGLF